MRIFKKNKKRPEVPNSVLTEGDDKPAARAILITIVIFIGLLGLVYLIFFSDYKLTFL